MTEEWKIIDWAPAYSVSSEGRVHSSFRGGRILVQTPNTDGYPHVTLSADGRLKTVNVAQLVCTAFRGPRPSPIHQVAHEDGIPANSDASNLSWKTPTENMADRLRHGNAPRGERCGTAILTDAQAENIRQRYVAGRGRWHRGNAAILANEFGVSMSTVWDIGAGRTRQYGGAV